MFGLTFEKLFLVAIIAGIVLGPQRLPGYAQQLARAVRSMRRFVESTRSAAEDEMGVPLRRSEWESIDLRQYDPRRIVGDALRETDGAPRTEWPDEVLAEALRVRPGQKYVIAGAASHPSRILIDSLPGNDPRRIAARLQPSKDTAPSGGQ